MSTDTIQQSTSEKTFAVVGSTGKQGGAVARALLAAGAGVRALVRDPQTPAAKDLETSGAHLVRADFDDPASLRAAFEGVDAVFAMTTNTGPRGADGEVDQGFALTDAAVAAGVPRVVFSSVGGAERHTGVPHFDSKRRVEERLEATGISTTFIRPVFFMENFTGPLTPTLEDGTMVVRLPLPAGIPLQMVATADIGAIATVALLQPERAPHAIEIAGDELTGEQIAAAYGARAGTPARYEALPLSVLGGDADMTPMFAWFARLPAYQADFAATKALAPSVQDFGTWLEARG